jgi:hypothetical protein
LQEVLQQVDCEVVVDAAGAAHKIGGIQPARCSWQQPLALQQISHARLTASESTIPPFQQPQHSRHNSDNICPSSWLCSIADYICKTKAWLAAYLLARNMAGNMPLHHHITQTA